MIRTSLVAAVALLALLGACSDDDPEPDIADPTPTPTQASESATVSTSPSETAAPALGPEETVRAWVRAWNDALHTGDTTTLRGFDADECRGCDELIGPVEEIVSNGGTFAGGEWKVDGLALVSATSSRAQVNLGVDVAAGSTTQSQGDKPSPYPATKHLLRFELVTLTQEWRVSVIEVLS